MPCSHDFNYVLMTAHKSTAGFVGFRDIAGAEMAPT